MPKFDSINLSLQIVLMANIALAALLGSLIGWERDRAGKSAGPRTMALVCVSASAIVGIGAVLDKVENLGDPTRAMHGVVTGIGFLGAGLIFQSRESRTQGVTTAATVFATAAVGCAVGIGLQVTGVGLSLAILIVLRSTQVLEITSSMRSHDE
jgi:putative Mg2+ transporter-C (MgtC) family protein